MSAGHEMGRLKLHIPTESELEYRRYLISDKETMEYNMGYGDNGGCTYQRSLTELQEWYKSWNNGTQNFYAYIVRLEDNAFVGEVNVHKAKNENFYDMGIMIESKYRGMGYSTEALKLLLKQAFEVLSANAVYNSFEESRTAAVKAHISAGFREYKKENNVIYFVITKEEYQNAKT